MPSDAPDQALTVPGTMTELTDEQQDLLLASNASEQNLLMLVELVLKNASAASVKQSSCRQARLTPE